MTEETPKQMMAAMSDDDDLDSVCRIPCRSCGGRCGVQPKGHTGSHICDRDSNHTW